MERAKGVEPSTFSLATRRSTTELCPLILQIFKVVPFYILSNRQINLKNKLIITFVTKLNII